MGTLLNLTLKAEGETKRLFFFFFFRESQRVESNMSNWAPVLTSRSIGTVSLTQAMAGAGSPVASQTRTALRPFSTTFIPGFCRIWGNPAGTSFSAQLREEITLNFPQHEKTRSYHFSCTQITCPLHNKLTLCCFVTIMKLFQETVGRKSIL